MASSSERLTSRLKRKQRIRKKISGTAERPRLSVFRSDRHIYAQVVDDGKGVTLACVSSFEKTGSGGKDAHPRANKDICTALGKTLAERCKAKSIAQVVFDRNGNAFHGRIKALADGAREGGLQF